MSLNLPPDDPAAMFARAKLRQIRRNTLWRSARAACATDEAFQDSTSAIERAVAVQLETEFG